MARAFSDLLVDLSSSYENLEKANAVLAAEVLKLREGHDDFTDCTVMVPSEPALGGIIPPPPTSPVIASLDKSMRSPSEVQTPQPPAIEMQEHGEHGRYLRKLARLCERMEVSIAVMEARGAQKNDVANSNAPPLATTLPQVPLAIIGSRAHTPQDSTDHQTDDNELEQTRKEELELIATQLSERKKGSDFSLNWDGSRSNSRSWTIATNSLINEGMDYKRALDALSGAVILSYTAFLGAETEIITRSIHDYDMLFFILHTVYNVYFAVELFIRVRFTGVRDFFRGSESRWNVLDLFLVISAALDFVMVRQSSVPARLLRSIRIVRLARTFRIVRVLRNVREFQKMVYAITSSFKTLLYAVVILFFILYFFGVLFAYGAMEAREYYAKELGLSDLEQELATYWGTFFTGIYSCYLSVSGGQSWFFVVRPLSGYSTSFTFFFAAFIALTLFGVLNAVSAIFVESSLMSTQHYKDMIILDKEDEKKVSVAHIKEVFRQIDKDNSGNISGAELSFFLANDALRKYVEALDISADDTRMLFRLLDRDGSGTVEIEEFCEGCMRLKGEARAFDMQVLLMQMRAFLDKWSAFTFYVRAQLGIMDDRTSRMYSTIVPAVGGRC